MIIIQNPHCHKVEPCMHIQTGSIHCPCQSIVDIVHKHDAKFSVTASWPIDKAKVHSVFDWHHRNLRSGSGDTICPSLKFTYIYVNFFK